MAAPTQFEQMMLELANRIRLDPGAEFDRIVENAASGTAHDPDTTAAIRHFGVNLALLKTELSALTPAQPLAWNGRLADAAAGHSALMRDQDAQSHQLPGEPDLGARLRSAGYAYASAGENVFAYTRSPAHGHDGFIVDWGAGPDGMQTPRGHRDNLMTANFREMGIAALPETNAATSVGPWVVTQNLGLRSGVGPFLLGVAYEDSDGDAFYSLGEGRSGLAIAAEGRGSVATGAAGGYALELGEGISRVTLSGPAAAETVIFDVRLGRDNVKLDLVDGRRLLSSGDLDLVRGASSIAALGVGDVAFSGTDGGETLTGNGGANRLDGEGGSDIIEGRGGADELYGGFGADRIYGGDGDDRVDAGSGRDRVLGGAGGDVLRGGSGDDALFGGSGADFLYGGSQDDLMEGGDGSDRLEGGSGDDRAYGGTGSDRLYGGSGNEEMHGGAAGDRLRGGRGDDRLWGDTGGDDLRGGSGDDELRGGSGADRLFGEDGRDLLAGGSENDAVYGGTGQDRLYGGSGNDELRGDTAGDQLYGGSGNDVLWGATGADELHGATGNDTLRGGSGADRLHGGDGDDYLAGGSEDDLVHGGTGRDRVYGGSGNDDLRGETAADRLYGGSGDDRLEGATGADLLQGGSGRDVLHGGTGNDDLYGGADADVFVFRPDEGRDLIHDFDAEDRFRFEGGIVLSEIAVSADGGDAMLEFAGTTVAVIGQAGLVLDDLIA